MGNFIRSVLSAASAILQQKTVTPTTSQQNVGPDAGYDGLSQVTVNPIPSEYVIPTAITPSNSSPASMTSGAAYKPSANGYAISSYSSKTPSNSSPASLTSGDIYKMSGAGYAISSYNSITPSSSAPSLSSGGMYKMGGSGYAIDSYSSITPSSSGTYFSSGFKKMSSSGYAYSSQPSLTETTLWTNSNITSDFAAQTVTLSQSINNFTYIKFRAKMQKTDIYTSDYVISIYPVSELIKNTGSKYEPRPCVSYCASSKNHYRTFQYVSETSVKINNALDSSGSAANGSLIPVLISGLK